jgi:hypothetical protein
MSEIAGSYPLFFAPQRKFAANLQTACQQTILAQGTPNH